MLVNIISDKESDSTFVISNESGVSDDQAAKKQVKQSCIAEKVVMVTVKVLVTVKAFVFLLSSQQKVSHQRFS